MSAPASAIAAAVRDVALRVTAESGLSPLLGRVADSRLTSPSVRLVGFDAPIDVSLSDYFQLVPLHDGDLVLVVPLPGGAWTVVARIAGESPEMTADQIIGFEDSVREIVPSVVEDLDLEGPPGPTGPAGPTGPEGPEGPPGSITGVAAGGDLSGTYPNPQIASGVIVAGDINAALKPSGSAAAGTEALRALGTTASTAAAGNDSRLSDARTPTGAAGGDLAGTYPNPTIAAKKRSIARRNASFTVNHNTLSFPTFDTEVEDNDAMFAASATFITIKTAGEYLVTAQFGWPVGAMTRCVMGIFYTPSGGAGITMAADERSTGTTEGPLQNVSVLMACGVNDIFQIIVFQTNGTSANKTITPTNYHPRLSVVRLGA